MADDPSEVGGPTPGLSPDDLARLGELFTQHRDRLSRMVRLRIDRRVLGRLDPSDVIQEAYLEATRRYPEYLDRPTLPPYLWLRFLTAQRLLILHRSHLQTQARDAGREVSVDPEVSSAGLADHLLDSGTSPSQAAGRAELHARVCDVLARMDPADREVLALRHFEQLSNDEAALVLGVPSGTASQRYYRALKRLRETLGGGP